MNNIKQTVSIIITYKRKVFFVKRQDYLPAFPGYHSFPGGKVESSDNTDKIIDNSFTEKYPNEHINALQRECLEELELCLKKLFEQKKVKNFYLLTSAKSPDFNPIRIINYFYKLDLSEEVFIHALEDEAKEYYFDDINVYIQRYQNGKILAVPPIVTILNELNKNIGTESIEHFENSTKNYDKTVYFEVIKDLFQLLIPSNTLPPAIYTNAFIFGDENKILVDPSPKNTEEQNKLIKLINDRFQKVDTIFLTHHHKDHIEFSNEIAKELNCKMVMSSLCKKLLEQKDKLFFKDIKVHTVKQNDVIAKWKENDVIVHEVPGHDNSQLALASRDLEWFIAGDLIQGFGSVVVGGPNTSMTKYLESLKYVIDLNPSVVIPSHGIATGGTFILKKTHKHRLDREKQIMSLFNQGYSIKSILEEIYKDIPENLKRYALLNINSHLDRIKK